MFGLNFKLLAEKGILIKFEREHIYMKKLILTFFLLHCCIICFSQKSMIEEIQPGQTISMKVISYGDTFTDPSEYYIIQIVKVDSIYALSYTYRGAQKKKKIKEGELVSLIDYEKNAPDKHAGRAYDEVTIICGKKTKRFLTVPNADVVFLKKLNLL